MKLELPLKDLAFRFGPFRQYLEFFSTWMVALDIRLSPSVSWPDREYMWSTMPQCFQESFLEKVTVIIDCFEVFINRPSGLYVSTQTIFLLQEPLYCNVFDWNHTSRQYFFCFQSVGWKNIRQIPTTRRFSFSRSWFYHTKVLSSIRPNYLFQHSQEGKTCWTQ